MSSLSGALDAMYPGVPHFSGNAEVIDHFVGKAENVEEAVKLVLGYMDYRFFVSEGWVFKVPSELVKTVRMAFIHPGVPYFPSPMEAIAYFAERANTLKGAVVSVCEYSRDRLSVSGEGWPSEWSPELDNAVWIAFRRQRRA